MQRYEHYLTKGHIQHVFLLVCRQHSMGEGILVVDQLKSLVQLHGFRDEKHLESIEQTLDNPLVIDIPASVNLSPTNTVTPNKLYLLVFPIRALVLPESLHEQLKDLHVRVKFLVSLGHKLVLHMPKVFLHQGKPLPPLCYLLLFCFNLLLQSSLVFNHCLL